MASRGQYPPQYPPPLQQSIHPYPPQQSQPQPSQPQQPYPYNYPPTQPPYHYAYPHAQLAPNQPVSSCLVVHSDC